MVNGTAVDGVNMGLWCVYAHLYLIMRYCVYLLILRACPVLSALCCVKMCTRTVNDTFVHLLHKRHGCQHAGSVMGLNLVQKSTDIACYVTVSMD